MSTAVNKKVWRCHLQENCFFSILIQLFIILLAASGQLKKNVGKYFL